MTAWDARDMGQDDVEVAVYTPEDAPLAIFGERRLRRRCGPTSTRRASRRPAPRADGSRRGWRRGRPPARRGTPRCAGLPRDERGFVPVDEHGRVRAASTASGPPATASRSRSSRAASPPSRPTPPPAAIAARAGAAVDPEPFRPVLRGVLLTGRGRRWIRRELDTAGDHGEAQRRALWWPPTKVAGAYLAPYLAMHAHGPLPGDERPTGRLVEFSVPAGSAP